MSTALLPRIPQEILRELAIAAKVCVRPVLLRCTEVETETTNTHAIPCGSTVERACPSCADRKRRLRIQQCREGWHRDTEPEPLDPDDEPLASEPGTDDDAEHHGEGPDTGDAIGGVDNEDHNEDDPGAGYADAQGPEEGPDRRVRSTRRRQDVADLPRVPMEARTLGREFRGPGGRIYRPSMFLTLTLPSYGRVRSDGTPVHPDSYDYRRAAMDALHFSKLVDRFWQNQRRCAGYKAQYFATVEPQRRLAPHLHAAVRGVIPRQVVRQVIAATYHQLWWPPCDRPVYPGVGDPSPAAGYDAFAPADAGAPPVWDHNVGGFVDPGTGAVLPTWAQALDDIDADLAAKPAHVLRFGSQFDYQGIIATDEDKINRAVGYLTKYLTKDMGATHDDDEDLTPAQAAHLNRLHAHVRVLPCSPRCANWLRYGIQPQGADAHTEPGRCRAKAHDRHHLGLGGRRVLVSRQWTGKTLTEHAADRAEAVRQVLEDAGLTAPDRDRCSATALDADGKPRFVWSKVAHHDQDAISYSQAIAASVRQRETWREQYEQAKARTGPPGTIRSRGDQGEEAA